MLPTTHDEGDLPDPLRRFCEAVRGGKILSEPDWKTCMYLLAELPISAEEAAARFDWLFHAMEQQLNDFERRLRDGDDTLYEHGIPPVG